MLLLSAISKCDAVARAYRRSTVRLINGLLYAYTPLQNFDIVVSFISPAFVNYLRSVELYDLQDVTSRLIIVL